MENLQISGTSSQKENWNVEEILQDKPQKSVKQMVDEMIQYDWDNKVSRCGMTYLEIEQFNNQYNNF